MQKIRIGILCGGKSAEHEISLLSARDVAHALDKEKYDVVVIGIDKKGKWFLHDKSHLLTGSPETIALPSSSKKLGYALDNSKELVSISETDPKIPLDVIFPVLHGTYGEDGTVQGFLKLAGVPFVGADVLGSALGMDKDVMKRLLQQAKIPVAKFLVYKQNDAYNYKEITKKLGLPFFIKPANLGSSIGISKVHNKKEFKKAIDEAFSYDTKILCEQYIPGREIECSVLGNENRISSIPGEVIPHDEFYSYKAKYLDPHGADLEIPAKLSKTTIKKVQKMAIKTCEVLCIEGMARVDFFVQKNGKIFVNEVNTIPGFTNISMYPKMWEASGLKQGDLLDRLIQLAIERYERDNHLKTSFIP